MAKFIAVSIEIIDDIPKGFKHWEYKNGQVEKTKCTLQEALQAMLDIVHYENLRLDGEIAELKMHRFRKDFEQDVSADSLGGKDD